MIFIFSLIQICVHVQCVYTCHICICVLIYVPMHMHMPTGDKYNPNDAPNRQVKRAIEKENQKVCMHVNVSQKIKSQKVYQMSAHMHLYVRTYVSICLVNM